MSITLEQVKQSESHELHPQGGRIAVRAGFTEHSFAHVTSSRRRRAPI